MVQRRGMNDVSSVPPPQATVARREWRLAGIIFFAVLSLAVLYATLVILWPFLTAILLGAVIVTLTFPTYHRVRDRMRGKSAAAAIVMLLGVTLLVIVPFTIIGIMLVQQANIVFQRLQSVDAQKMLQRIDVASRLQWIRRIAPGFDPASVSPERLVLPAIRMVPAWVASHGAEVVGSIAGVAIAFALVLLASYFFYVEGDAILAELRVLSPLPAKYDREFGSTFKEVINATFLGQISSTVAQGVATGVGLAIVGVPGAAFWGAVVAVFGLLPMVGAAIVWIPTAIYLYIGASNGERPHWQWIFMIVWGLLVVQLIDHVIRPLVMRGKSQLPAIPLLFSIFGGLHAFGFMGLIIGPLVFSLLTTIIDIYKRSFGLARSEGEAA